METLKSTEEKTTTTIKKMTVKQLMTLIKPIILDGSAECY